MKAVLDEAVRTMESASFFKAKVMAVGQGRGGKTSLLAALLNQRFDLHNASTRGADMSDVTVDSVEAKMW